MLSLRIATQEDLPLIHALAHEIWPPTFGDILSSSQIDYMLNMMYSIESLEMQLNGGAVFMVLNDDEAPIGYVSYQFDYLPNTTKIHKLYVLPNQQGKGCGKFMIDAVDALARDAQEQLTLRLDVYYQNKAIGFYEHLGFKIM